MMMFLRIALHQTPVALFLDFVFQVGAKNFLPQIPFVKLKLAGQMEVLGRMIDSKYVFVSSWFAKFKMSTLKSDRI